MSMTRTTHIDPRWQAVAEVLVHYSTDVQPGERVMIAMGEIESFPLAHAVYESCIKAGACPQVQFLSEKLRHSMLRTRLSRAAQLGAGDRSAGHVLGRCLFRLARRLRFEHAR